MDTGGGVAAILIFQQKSTTLPLPGEVAEWFKAADLKSADPQGSVSSNLTLSAKKAQNPIVVWKNALFLENNLKISGPLRM